MSTRILNHVLYNRLGLTPAQKLILVSLADQANDDGWCWPSMSYTAARCEVNRDTVFTAIHELEARGLLEVRKRPGTSSYYRVVVPTHVGKSDNHLSDNPTTGVGNTDNTCRIVPNRTTKNHQITHDDRVRLDIEQAKRNRAPMPDTLKDLIAK